MESKKRKLDSVLECEIPTRTGQHASPCPGSGPRPAVADSQEQQSWLQLANPSSEGPARLHPEQKRYKCPYCINLWRSDPWNLNLHRRRVHEELADNDLKFKEALETPQQIPLELKRGIKCDECDMVLLTKKLYVQHMKNIHQQFVSLHLRGKAFDHIAEEYLVFAETPRTFVVYHEPPVPRTDTSQNTEQRTLKSPLEHPPALLKPPPLAAPSPVKRRKLVHSTNFIQVTSPPIPRTDTFPSTPSGIQEQVGRGQAAARGQAGLVCRAPKQDQLRIPDPPITPTDTSSSTPSGIQKQAEREQEEREQAEREQAGLVGRAPEQGKLRIPFLLANQDYDEGDTVMAYIALCGYKTGRMLPG
ncbi:uncharacterized protein PG998_002925 [Apiospora kogelbergensis]|uniref:uncharacterized protein n=1 Tax=Apiospora kogelbergensis TaxID=1337665 RepID=UPI0031326F09